MSISRIVIFVGLSVLLAVVAAIVVNHSITGALKALKLALKSEFTTNVGRLNLVGMILFVVAIFVFNLHQMIAEALFVGNPPPAENHVIGPGILIGLFFLGSLICVMVVDRQK